jgi:hypothetical protein
MLERLRNTIQTRPRRSLLIGFSILMFCFVLLSLFSHRNIGTVIITTNDTANNIEISDPGGKVLSSAHGSLKANLTAGQYVATVNNKASSSKKTVEIEAHQTSTYSINLAQPADPEYVLPLGAAYMVIGNNAMYYVNLSDHLLYRLGSDGIPAVADQSVAFSEIRWQNEHFGIGLNRDRTSLYEINDGASSKIGLPFSSKQATYDVSPSGRLDISNSKTVYSREKGGGFKKIFTSDKPIASVAANNDSTLLTHSSGVNSEGGEKEAVVINRQGKVIGSSEALSGYEHSWSADGSKLAVTGDTSTKIYDKHLNQIAVLPDIHATGLNWVDNHTLIYGVSGQIFSHSLSDSTSTLLATTPTDSDISGVYAALSGSQVYVSVSERADSNKLSLLRVGLTKTSQNIPDYYLTLGIFFPSYTDQCSFSYTNFQRPVMLITAWTDTDTCLDAAKEELVADELPVAGFQIQFAGPVDE